MKEKDLTALGFKRTDVTAEESGYETDWYYYSYTFGTGAICLITNYSTEIEKDEWYVEVLEDETIRFTNTSDIIDLINLIKRNETR